MHTEFSHDCKAPLDLVIETAERAGLDFVIVTDHNNMKAAKAYQAMKKPPHPLLIFGDEISTWYDGHLVVLGIDKEPPDIGDTQEIVNIVHQKGGYAIPAHPFSKRKPWTNWKIENFDGLELFCFSDIFYSEGFKLLPKIIFSPPKAFLKSVLKTPTAALRFWDERLRSGRRLTAFASADAHLKFRWQNFYVENLLLYFQAVTTYVLADELKEEKIVEALGHGKSFIAFEAWGVAQDFSFSASAANKNHGPGDSLGAESPILFTIKVPAEADIRLIHNGEIIAQNTGTVLEYKNQATGYYRVEAYREGELWIASNPIYVSNSKSEVRNPKQI